MDKKAGTLIFIYLLVSCTSSLFSQCLPFLSGEVPVYSSSELNPTKIKDYGIYGAVHLFDNDTTKCWATSLEGKETPNIFFPLTRGDSSFQILNGYTKSMHLYKANARLRSISCGLFLGIFKQGSVSEMHEEYCLYDLEQKFRIQIQDTMKWQKNNFSVDWEQAIAKAEGILRSKGITPVSGEIIRFFLKISVDDIYKGNIYNDLCISELKLQERQKSYQFSNPDNGEIVIIQNSDTTGVLKDKDYVYMIIEEDPYSGYCIVQELPSNALGVSVGGEGRFMLVNKYADLINPSAIVDKELNIYGFKKEKTNILLDAYTIDGFEEIPFNLTIWSVLNP